MTVVHVNACTIDQLVAMILSCLICCSWCGWSRSRDDRIGFIFVKGSFKIENYYQQNEITPMLHNKIGAISISPFKVTENHQDQLFTARLGVSLEMVPRHASAGNTHMRIRRARSQFEWTSLLIDQNSVYKNRNLFLAREIREYSFS